MSARGFGLYELAQLPLQHVLVSAEVIANGRLAGVGGMPDKLQAAREAIRQGRDLRAVGLAREDQKGEACFLDEHRPLLWGDTLEELTERFVQHFGPGMYGRALELPEELLHQGEDGRYDRLHRRQWLLDRVSDHVDAAQEQRKGSYTLITSGPTWGKTSFALEWVRASEPNAGPVALRLAGWSFIRQTAQGEHVHGVSVLLGLEHRARLRLNLELPEPHSHEFLRFAGCDGNGFRLHLEQFFKDCSRWASDTQQPCVLLLDAVDEIWGPQGSEPAQLLPAALPDELPSGVHLVLTSRPGEHLKWQGYQPEGMLHLHMGDQELEEQQRRDAEGLIESYARRWSGPEREDYGDAEVLLRSAKMRALLLAKSQCYLFYLRAVLDERSDWLSEEERELPLHERLRRWQADPSLLPAGARVLVARIVVRLIWGRADDKPELRRRRAMLLGMAALLRDASLSEEQLVDLLLDENGQYPGDGARIAAPDRSFESIGKRDLGGHDDLLGALAQLRSCWVRPQESATELAFNHLLLRECAAAAWVTTRRRKYDPSTRQKEHDLAQEIAKLSEQELSTHEAMWPLHHTLGRAASRRWVDPDKYDPKRPALSWPDTPDQWTNQPERYARVWGAWHAAMSQEPKSRKLACHLIVDARHLQDAFTAGQIHAIEAVGETWQALRKDDVVVAVVANSIRPALDRISQGKLQVAQEMWNLLGGWDEVKKRGLDTKWYAAAARGAWMSVKPGDVKPEITVVEGFEAEYMRFIYNPDGTPRWWVMAEGPGEVRVYDISDGADRPRRIEVRGIESDSNWTACEVIPVGTPRGQFAGVWLAGDLGLVIQLDAQGRVATKVAGGEREAMTQRRALLPIIDGEGHPDGVWLVTGGEDDQVRLIRSDAQGLVAAGERKVLIQHNDFVTDIALLPVIDGNGRSDGGWLASGGADGEVRLVRLDAQAGTAGEPEAVIRHKGRVEAIALLPAVDGEGSPSGLWLAASLADTSSLSNAHVRLIRLDMNGGVDAEIASGGREVVIQHEVAPDKIALLQAVDGQGRPDGVWLATGSLGPGRLIRLRSDCGVTSEVFGTGHGLVIQHEEYVSAIDLMPLGGRGGHYGALWLASGGADGEVRLVRLNVQANVDPEFAGGQPEAAIRREGGIEDAIALLPAVEAEDRSCTHWLAVGGPPDDAADNANVRLIRLKMDDRIDAEIASGAHNVVIRHKPQNPARRGAVAPVTAIALVPAVDCQGRPDGLWLASAVAGKVHLIRMDALGQVDAKIAGGGRKAVIQHKTEVFAIALLPAVEGDGHPSGLWLACGGADGEVRLSRLDALGRVDTKIAGGGRKVLIQHKSIVDAIALLPAAEGDGYPPGVWLAASGKWVGDVCMIRLDGKGLSQMPRPCVWTPEIWKSALADGVIRPSAEHLVIEAECGGGALALDEIRIDLATGTLLAARRLALIGPPVLGTFPGRKLRLAYARPGNFDGWTVASSWHAAARSDKIFIGRVVVN